MLLKRKKEELFNYLEDTSNMKGEASILYLPQSRGEVSFAVRELVSKRMPFTASAGRTGTTGGCVPNSGAIISLEGIDTIIDIDKNRQIAVVEAGVSLEGLENEANGFNLTLRASPTESLAQIGGVVSTAASGVRGFGYGSIRNYITGLEVVLTTGETINIKRGEIISSGRSFDFERQGRQFKFNLPSYNMPEVKSQAGYFADDDTDLIDIFIGSEGTLGVITSCEVLLQKVPFRIFDGLLFFSKENDACALVGKVKEMKRKGRLMPASLEFFDRNSLRMLRGKYSFVPPAAAALYFEQETENDKDYDCCFDKWQILIEGSGALLDKSILAENSRDRKKIFEFRHSLPQMINEFLRQNRQLKCATDISVPWANFEEMYNFYQEEAEKSRIDYVNFGHIGESHLHFNFLTKTDHDCLKAKEYIKLFCKKGIFLGGTVSAEHGIGKIKRPYLKFMYNDAEIKEMAALKKYFDPNCLLGLDNIFDKELLL